MARLINFQGRTLSFPDEANDADIQAALASAAPPPTSPQTTVAEAVFPRASEATGAVRTAIGGALDVASLPGRAADALMSVDWEGRDPYAETLGSGFGLARGGSPQASRPLGMKSGGGVVSDIIRDPALPVTLAAGGPLASGAARLGLGGVRGLMAAGAAEGAVSAATHQAENVAADQPVDFGKTAFEIGTGALTGAAGGALSSALKKHGTKTVVSTMKPSGKDIADGFKASNVYKYGLDGTLEQSAQKADDLFRQLSTELREKIGSSDAKIDVTDVLSDALSSISKGKADYFGKNAGMEKAAQFFLDEINTVSPDGVVDLATAQQIKRGTGKIGAWSFGSPDPEANAREAFADVFYTKLKKAIEDAAPEGVKEINKQLSELIPIEKAIVRRLPVEQRNSPVGLFDMISLVGGGGTGMVMGGPVGAVATGAGTMMAQRAARSPRVGAAGFRLGEVMQAAPPVFGRFGRQAVRSSIFTPENEEYSLPETLGRR